MRTALKGDRKMAWLYSSHVGKRKRLVPLSGMGDESRRIQVNDGNEVTFVPGETSTVIFSPEHSPADLP